MRRTILSHDQPGRAAAERPHRAWSAIIVFVLVTAWPTEAAERVVLVDPEKPLHEQTLSLLRNTDSVIPARLDIHPVTALFNREAIIPPQCYTRTEGRFNPCYVCHQNSIRGRENTMNDGGLQAAYSFSDVGTSNHWRNLFEDRRAAVGAISDEEIRDWIDQDNYSELAPRLRSAGFEGWIPDLTNLADAAEAFDEEGFARDGSDWVAFNYKPLPSTFWPTNGSTDDVMVRLPEAYRTDTDGNPSRDIYRANLAILEANIKGLSGITTASIDERAVGFDLDRDGRLGSIEYINQLGSFVGGARGFLFQAWLYPAGTEFLHTVRYVGITPEGNIVNAKRMKEVRYMYKRTLFPKSTLDQLYREEGYAKDQGYLPTYVDLGQRGLYNDMGWVIQGFIEDRHGRLRVNTFEENMFCMGCHTSIGSTIDKTFSFPRKIDGAAGWGYIDLRGMPDAPNKGESTGEIATYFERVGGGGEFRSNEEMQARWFLPDGSVDEERVGAANDVYELITPSPRRALDLNKAYRVIVAQQTFLYGRDATLRSPVNVYDGIDNDAAPTLGAEHIYAWDIRLDWRRFVSGTAEKSLSPRAD